MKISLSATQQDIVRKLQGVGPKIYGGTWWIRVVPDHINKTTLYLLENHSHRHLDERVSTATIRALLRKGVLVQSMPGHRPVCELSEEWKE